MSTTPISQDIKALSPRTLQEALTQDEAFEKAHIVIYNHIHSRILPNATREQSVPPLHVVIYVARTHLRPHVIPKTTPSLLECLATIENGRQMVVSQMESILNTDTQLKRNGLPAEALTSSQRRTVRELKAELAKLRKVYREVICGLCLYHVYETGALKEDVSNLLLTYFPVQALWDEDVSGVEAKHPFHYGLTNDERKQLEATAQVYLDLLAKFIDDNPPDLSPAEFRARYPCPAEANSARIASRALQYLDELEDTIRTVNSILQ